MVNKSKKGKSKKTLTLQALKLKKDPRIEQGTMIGKKYKILRVLGSGGMGTVYLAEDTKLERNVAIKTISEEISKDRDLRKRLIREAKTLSRLEHPNICSIFEIVEEKGRDYIIMQHVDGNSLDEIPPNAITWEQKIEIIYQIALGLKSAHHENIIHRDLKPSNIKIDRRGYVKILDFGLAKEAEADEPFFTTPTDETLPVDEYNKKWKTALTNEGTILGTVYYMSPEQARGEHIDLRSDIFSFGTLMYELTSGRLPYPEADTISALYHIVNTAPDKLGKVIPGTPRRLTRIIYKALEKKPEERYQDMDEMLEDIEKLRSEIGISSAARMTTEMKKIAVLDPHEARRTDDTAKRPLSQITSAITTVRRQIRRRKWQFAIGLITVLLAIFLYQAGIISDLYSSVFSPEEPTPNIIVISKFESKKLPLEVGEVVQLLIVRSLSQLPGTWFIDDSTLHQIQDKLGTSEELNEINMKILHKHEGVIAYVTGTLNSFGSEKMIEVHPNIATVFTADEKIIMEEIRLDITPGEGEQAILMRIVDEISTEIKDKLGLIDPGNNLRGIASITTDSWKALLLYTKAEKMWALRKSREAERLLEQALKIDPDFALARGRYAEILKFQGDKVKTLENLKLILDKPDKLTYADRLYFGSLRAELELDYLKQMELLRELYKYRPLDWNTSFALAEAYFHRGLIKEAKGIYEDTLDLSPKFAQALNHYGYCLSYLGEHQEAINALKQYKEFDKTYNAYDSLGDGYFFAADYDKAILYKKAAIQQNKSIDWIYRSLADFYLTLGNVKAATETNEQFAEVAGQNKKALAEVALQKAHIYLLTDRRPEAKEEIEKARKLYGKQEIFHFIDEMQWLSGQWFLEGGQVGEARKELGWLGKIVNDNGISEKKYFTFYKYYLHLKALCDYHDGQTQAARQTMRQLVNLGPKLGYWITIHHRQYYLTEAARMEYEMQNYDEAERLLSESLAYSPDYPYALFYQGRVFIAQGRTSEGKESLRKYLKICSDGDKNFFMIRDANRLLGK